MSDEVIVLGAGGHGKVIADAVIRSNRKLIGFLDDRDLTSILGVPVLGLIDDWVRFQSAEIIIGIGDNTVRHRVAARIKSGSQTVRWATVIHPSAVIAGSVSIGKGVAILAGTVVSPDTQIGDHVIVNTGSTVDHDCVIGDFVHIAPGANLAGGVRVDTAALIGIGAVVIPGCHIGAHSVIGAGAAVVSDIPPGVTAKGVPARW